MAFIWKALVQTVSDSVSVYAQDQDQGIFLTKHELVNWMVRRFSRGDRSVVVEAGDGLRLFDCLKCKYRMPSDGNYAIEF